MRFVALLFAAFLVVGCGGGAPAPTDPSSAKPSEAPLEDGVYAVNEEIPAVFATPPAAKPGERVIRYDPTKADTLSREPARFVRLGLEDHVPLAIEVEPELGETDEGKQLLHVAIDEGHGKRLEMLTRKHVGGKLAIVFDNEILSVHKVRAVVTGGHLQITRCTDRACQSIKAKLLQKYPLKK